MLGKRIYLLENGSIGGMWAQKLLNGSDTAESKEQAMPSNGDEIALYLSISYGAEFYWVLAGAMR